VTYKSMTDIFQDVLNRRLDGFVTDRLVGLYQIGQGGMPFVPAGPLIYEEKLAIPVTQGNDELLDNINQALLQMEKSGELQAFHDKWFASPSQKEAHAVAPMEADIIMQKLLHGFGITILVGLSSSLLGFMVAIPFGIALNRNIGYLTAVLRFWNDFIRATPLLIQLFFVYFGAPQIGIVLSPLQAAIITLTVNSSAYMAEVIRSGLMAVDYGQNLAGIALGLTKFHVFRFIVWPQAFRVALPSLMNAVVALMKDTSLIAVISVAEVIREAQSIISVTYNPIKYYFIVGLMFCIISFPLMKLAERVEKSIKAKGFSNA
jgi:His/Glu/Gln/Arg/opine family amino acid ABC transporter permease subunit